MSVLNLSRHAYLFAQALDNSGDSEYWVASAHGESYDKLDHTDQRLRLIRNQIDKAAELKQNLPLQGQELNWQTTLSGVCLITARPITLDAGGRISPVLMLLNIYGGTRGQTAYILRAILGAMGRELSKNAIAEIDQLQQMLNWPRPILFVALLLAKLRSNT